MTPEEREKSRQRSEERLDSLDSSRAELVMVARSIADSLAQIKKSLAVIAEKQEAQT